MGPRDASAGKRHCQRNTAHCVGQIPGWWMASGTGKYCVDWYAAISLPFAQAYLIVTVIFGEVIPQSVCVRYGLPIGAWMSPFVLVLMYLLAPAAWPTAKLLDYLLGEDHGTTYKKAGLKTLVTLHKSLGEAGEQLNQDEVTIISAVLDLKAKPVGSIMTPMEDVFTMSSDTVLDEKTMEVILGAGYSRIPIHAPDNKENFVGMLLVKILITYDPEDARRVSDFALATLPETRSETSCLDIVNFFQEGKSHMVLVSEFPGDNYGALGVVTLEDVIEELIGEEIIDESDVFVDVHKAIRRMTPAPKSRVPKGAIVEHADHVAAGEREPLLKEDKDHNDGSSEIKRAPTAEVQALRANRSSEGALSPNRTSLRRTSSAQVGSDREGMQKKPMPSGIEHLKHLGPSNPASRPKTTRYNTVKVKPGPTPLTDGQRPSMDGTDVRKASVSSQPGPETNLLRAAGRDAKDGVLALHAGYGSIPSGSPPSPKNSRKGILYAHAEEKARNSRSRSANRSRRSSESTLGSLSSGAMLSPRSSNRRPTARSGSITENIIDSGGIQKTVLELTSSSEEQDKAMNGQSNSGEPTARARGDSEAAKGGKKKRRRRKKKGNDENEPLLDN